MVAGMWWFFTLIMVSSYTANLAAFLTTENTEVHFSDVNELVEKADKLGIKYGAKANGATATFFIVSFYINSRYLLLIKRSSPFIAALQSKSLQENRRIHEYS